MGYRSDIYIKATHDIAHDLYITLQQAGLLDYTRFNEDDEYIYATLFSMKWYNSYPEVQQINKFIDSQPPGKITMLRNGEDGDDIEEYGTDPSALDMYYHQELILEGFTDTTIDFNVPKLEAQYPELFI